MRWVLAVATLAACQPARAPVPAPPEEARLLSARDLGDVDTMRAHAWELWAGLQPEWQSWPRSDVVLGAPDRIFRRLQPFKLGDRVEVETLPLMFAIAFNPEAAAHVTEHRLALQKVARRHAAIPAFPRGSILLKAVWYPVHRNAVTPLPIWDGEPAHPDVAGNPARTWSRKVAIDPAGADRDVDGIHHVPLDAFVHRPLSTPAELAAARSTSGDRSLALGDEVVLIAMHVSTKEIPDWVWATYWWHDRADEGVFAAGRPATISGAARSYLMDVAYSAQTPRESDGSPHVAMNPWLEARFSGGLHSNCVACHQRAVLGAEDYLPVTRGLLPQDDRYFRGKTTTDFVWSLALEAH